MKEKWRNRKGKMAYSIKRPRGRLPALFLALVMSAFLAIVPPADVNAVSLPVPGITASRTMQDIAAQWDKLVLPHAGGFPAEMDIFAEKPVTSSPYSYGTLREAYLQDGLDRLNFARWLSGLPGDVSLDVSLANRQQATAVVNAANDTLSHAPGRPSGMTEDFFQQATEGAGSSNLAAGYRTLSGAVQAYLSDSDPYNISRLGHRRWVLNPAMKSTMFGAAMTGTNYPYSSMRSFDTSRNMTEMSGYGHVSWPSAGFFPMEMFASDDPWSVSLNTAEYDRSKTAEISVSLTRIRDGRAWTFDGSDTDLSGEYFNVETSGYGVPFCVIFRPAGVGSLQDGDTFSVAVTGLYGKDGTRKEVRFDTTFFRMADVVRQATLRILMHPGESLQLRIARFEDGITSNPVQYSMYNGFSTADVTPDGLVTAGAAGYAFVRAKPLSGAAEFVQISVRAADPADPVSSWARTDYDLARVNGLTNGLDWGYRYPVTRLEFAGLAVNLCEKLTGRIFAETTEPFSDTNDSAVAKAYQAGLIKGTSATTYAPAKKISRQEAAILLMNVQRFLLQDATLKARLSAKGIVLPEMGASGESSTAVSTFADDASIASWAKPDVIRSSLLGLLKGGTGNQYDPLGNLTREQTFAILQRQYASFKPSD